MTSSINYYIKFLIIIPRIIRLNNSPPHPKKKKLFFHFHATRIKKRSDALDRKRLYAGHWVTIHDQMASVAARAGANRRRQRHAPGHVLPREHTCDTRRTGSSVARVASVCTFFFDGSDPIARVNAR